MIKISVIIPTYNRVGFIHKAINSVLEQSYKVNEIIVVDNNSNDNTSQKVRKLFPKIKVIKETKQGVSNARNAGIAASKNKWIAFLDSDDIWLPKKIELQVNKIREFNYKPLFIHTDEIWMRNGKFLNQRKKHKKREGNIFLQSLKMCIISPSSVLINKSLFYKYGCFDSSLKVCEDYELWLNFLRKVPIYLVKDACLVKNGGHADQLSKRYWGMDRFRVKALESLIKKKLSDKQRKEVIKTLISKVNIIIAGAKNRKNFEILKIYEFKKKYWEKKLEP